MKKLIHVTEPDGTHYGWAFECPGCGENHCVTSGWTFNGDEERPTFSPSLLVRGVERITDDEHARIMRGEQVTQREYVCHSFIVEGRIQFLADCTHHLAGKTVEMADVT